MGTKVKFAIGSGDTFRRLEGEIISDPKELASLDPRAYGIPMDRDGRMHAYLLRARGLLSQGKSGKAVAVKDHTGKVWYKMSRSVKRKEG